MQGQSKSSSEEDASNPTPAQPEAGSRQNSFRPSPETIATLMQMSASSSSSGSSESGSSSGSSGNSSDSSETSSSGQSSSDSNGSDSSNGSSGQSSGYSEGSSSGSSEGSSSGSSSSSSSNPSIQIESFEFGGVYDKLYIWQDGNPGQPTPNKYNQKWVRGGSAVGNNAALYSIATYPVFKLPEISISPSISPTTVSVRVLYGNGGVEVARKDGISISGASDTLPDITSIVTASAVGFAVETLYWEVSFDEGTNWESMGNTDPIDFYDIPGDPLVSKVYDFGLEWACLEIDAAGISNYASTLNTAIAASTVYNPGENTGANWMDGSGWVLQVLQSTTGEQCLSNAYLLYYLLQSIGVSPGNVKAYWSGTASTNRVYWRFLGTNPTPPCVNYYASAQQGCACFNSNRSERQPLPVVANPRFNFHAMTVVAGTTYDPSYGLSGAAATAAPYNLRNGCSEQIGTWANFTSTTLIYNC